MSQHGFPRNRQHVLSESFGVSLVGYLYLSSQVSISLGVDKYKHLQFRLTSTMAFLPPKKQLTKSDHGSRIKCLVATKHGIPAAGYSLYFW